MVTIGTGRHNEKMNEIQFLESTQNLRRHMVQSQGWRPSPDQAWSIAACVRQGRLFFESAKASPLEIRPLELYYGTAAYAKAIVLATNRELHLKDLKQSHGVKDCSGFGSTLKNLQIAIQSPGAFHEFNDAVHDSNYVQVISQNSQPLKFPCEKSDNLKGLQLSLKDIFSRMPRLEKIYHATFGEAPNVDTLEISSFSGQYTLRTWSSERTEAVEQLIPKIQYLRERMPFLTQWAFCEASNAYGKTAIAFCNTPPKPDELSVDSIAINQEVEMFIGNQHPKFTECFKVDEGKFLTLIGDGAVSRYVQPIGDKYISIPSLNFMALHLLSSLVRYRPATWMHALSRTSNKDRESDDQMLAIVETFMDGILQSVPQFVVELIAPGLHV